MGSQTVYTTIQGDTWDGIAFRHGQRHGQGRLPPD